MPRIVLIQGSLSPTSKTATVIAEAAGILQKRGIDHEILDLRDLDMQFCDGRKLQDYNEDMQQAWKRIDSADGYIFGMPVYCYSVSGPLKNFIDITSGAMENKFAGLLCNTGGKSSYMAVADLAKILSFESHLLTVQPIPLSSYEDFDDRGQLISEKVKSKIGQMIDNLLPLL